MSGPLAIAAVSVVLRDLLQTGMTAMNLGPSLQGATGDVTVSVGAPDRVTLDGVGAVSGLNLFLYNVSRNQGWANVDLPSRDGRGDRISNPALGVDLYYLLTAYGVKDFDAEVLLGGALQVLHDMPGFGRQVIRDVLSTATNRPPNVALSGLADQIEQIKISPLPMTTEEIVRLWSAFQCNYRPSIAYLVSVVLLQSSLSTRVAPPVRTRNLYAEPFAAPRVDSVANADDPTLPIVPSSTVRVTGANLVAPGASLLVNDIDMTSGIVLAAPTQLLFKLRLPAQPPPPSAWPQGLYPGVSALRVVHPQDMGTPPAPHRSLESNLVPFVLTPVITPSPRPNAIRVQTETPIGKKQKVRLLLNQLNVPAGQAPRLHSFEAPAGNGVVAPAVDTSDFAVPVHDVTPGTYLVRAVVDGAHSGLSIGAGGAYATPKVTL